MGRAVLNAEPFGLASVPLPVLLGVLRNAGDRLHEGIYLLDPDGRVQYANPAAQRLFGVQRESQMHGREIEGFMRPIRHDVDDRRYNLLAENGQPAAQLGVIVRAGSRPAPATDKVASARPSVAEAFAICDLKTVDLNGEGLGCVAVRVFSTAPTVEVEAIVRDLGHLMARVTRPEDMVVRVDSDAVALFAYIDSRAGLKSIAERITARGRREVNEEFRVGIALGAAGATAATLAGEALSDYYTTKPRMRGRVAAHRSGSV